MQSAITLLTSYWAKRESNAVIWKPLTSCLFGSVSMQSSGNPLTLCLARSEPTTSHLCLHMFERHLDADLRIILEIPERYFTTMIVI